jgi:guanylate kinase
VSQTKTSTGSLDTGVTMTTHPENVSNEPAAADHGPARLTVLAGPTAVGKGTVAADIRERFPDIWISVSATTRKARPGEVHGVHYLFVSDAEFDRMIADGELLEWAVVHKAARYGTPRQPVLDKLAAGRPALLEIDLQGARHLQGARQVRASMPEAQFVFLAPPSWDELVRRLLYRGTETPEERERRLETATVELAAEKEFDVTIVNASVREAADQLVKLIRSPHISGKA